MSGQNSPIWRGIQQYSNYYNLPISHFVEVLQDPKVVPMIRGKAFEYTVSDFLRTNLPRGWTVSNPFANPQLGTHGSDVIVANEEEEREFTIECKLADGGSLLGRRARTEFRVKCMRSRQVQRGPAANFMARRYNVDVELVLTHKDAYRPMDFNLVITSVSNALWETNDDGMFEFRGGQQQYSTLNAFFPDRFPRFTTPYAFNREAGQFLLIARSRDIAVSPGNDITCTHRNCQQPNNCGFIPNFPVVDLEDTENGTGPWHPLPEGLQLITNPREDEPRARNEEPRRRARTLEDAFDGEDDE